MRTFTFATFRVSVREAEEEALWEALIEAPGAKPVNLMTGGEGPEAAVAIDLVRQLRQVFRLGIKDYVSETLRQDPEMDEGELKKSAKALFQMAQAAGGDEPLAAAQERLELDLVPPEAREMLEKAKRAMHRTYELGNVRISVRPYAEMGPGIVAFHILMEGPGFRDEDLMQRPHGYLLARIAFEHLEVMRRVLEWGIPRAVEHHMKVNYLGPEFSEKTQKYIEGLDRVGRALGEPEIERLKEALESEEEREAEERRDVAREFEARAEQEMLRALEAREHEIESRLEELRKKRRKK